MKTRKKMITNEKNNERQAQPGSADSRELDATAVGAIALSGRTTMIEGRTQKVPALRPRRFFATSEL